MPAIDWGTTAAWRERFELDHIRWLQVATQNHARGLVCMERNGKPHLYTWDLANDQLTPLSNISTDLGFIAPDGEHVYYFNATTDTMMGHYERVSFAGGPPSNISPAMPPYASLHLAETDNGIVVGYSAIAPEWGFRVYVQDHNGQILFTYESETLCVGPNLSHDGALAVIASTTSADSWDFTLEAYAIADGQKLGDLRSDKGQVQPIGFVPRANDDRYLATIKGQDGLLRPLLWQPRTGQQEAIDLEQLRGDVDAWDWSADGRYLLLAHHYQASTQLYRYDLETAHLLNVAHPPGTYTGASFVDDSIYAIMQNAVHPAQVIALKAGTDADTRLTLPAAPGYAWQHVHYPSADGATIQAWLSHPAGTGPFPTLIHMHGGPDDVVTERYDPSLLAWVDQGFAVLSINYRGSTTFGRGYAQAIIGQPGKLEVEDIVAGVDWLIERQIAQADHIFAMGAGYGGHLTLRALSHAPTHFAGGMAIVPIIDWLAHYETSDEQSRAKQRWLFGGEPHERSTVMQQASPMTHIQSVQAPLLIIQARNDPRYPPQPAEAYVERLRALGKSVDLQWYDAADGTSAAHRNREYTALMLRFVAGVLSQI